MIIFNNKTPEAAKKYFQITYRSVQFCYFWRHPECPFRLDYLTHRFQMVFCIKAVTICFSFLLNTQYLINF